MATAEEWVNSFRAEQEVSDKLRKHIQELEEKVRMAKEILAAAKMSPALIEKILGDK